MIHPSSFFAHTWWSRFAVAEVKPGKRTEFVSWASWP